MEFQIVQKMGIQVELQILLHHIEEHVVESFREVRKHAKRLENIVTSIEKFSLILANEKHIEDVLCTRKITHLMMLYK